MKIGLTLNSTAAYQTWFGQFGDSGKDRKTYINAIVNYYQAASMAVLSQVDYSKAIYPSGKDKYSPSQPAIQELGILKEKIFNYLTTDPEKSPLISTLSDQALVNLVMEHIPENLDDLWQGMKHYLGSNRVISDGLLVGVHQELIIGTSTEQLDLFRSRIEKFVERKNATEVAAHLGVLANSTGTHQGARPKNLKLVAIRVSSSAMDRLQVDRKTPQSQVQKKINLILSAG